MVTCKFENDRSNVHVVERIDRLQPEANQCCCVLTRTAVVRIITFSHPTAHRDDVPGGDWQYNEQRRTKRRTGDVDECNKAECCIVRCDNTMPITERTTTACCQRCCILRLSRLYVT